MTGSGTHLYTVPLKKDEFFQVRLEQKGIDAALKLIDSAGRELASMDSPNGDQGSETLSYVASETGDFILEIKAFDAAAKTGRYTIRRQPSRTATAADIRRVATERTFIEAIEARNANGKTSIAAEKFRIALEGWRELGDSYLIDLTETQEKRARTRIKYDEALTLSKGDEAARKQAIPKLIEVRASYVELGDKTSEARVMRDLGEVYSIAGDHKRAIEAYQKSLSLYNEIGEKTTALMLSDVGKAFARSGDAKKALEYYDRALPLARGADDKSG